MEREFKKGEEDVSGGAIETGSEKENIEVRDEVEEDPEERVRNAHEEDVKGEEESVERLIQVSDGHIALGVVQWMECRAETAGQVQQGNDTELSPKAAFDSVCSVSSYKIQVTEELMQHSAEALSHTGFPQRIDTQETVRKMAAMKTEHRVRLNTLKLLLERGADPNACRVPMPVLFFAVMAADTEAVRRLLLCGAHTDIPLPPERKGYYPLHVAAALPGPAGPMITELLLNAITDPDARACDQNEIYEQDAIVMNTHEPVFTNESPDLNEGGRTALHIACQRDSDYENASKVVALLLAHGARTDLLWSGHSPLSLAIASGNDLAVEVLLNGGADPNIPLGRGVASALCALANIDYNLGGNKIKLLGMLAKAGADILMPIMVGDVVGTAVDYAHYSFNQDLRIANTPFHALNLRERETYTARRQLLAMMGDLLRQTACEREKEYLKRADAVSSNMSLHSCDGLPHLTEKQRKPMIKFCYQCGRSVSVKLTPCSRCHKVSYCSKTCQLNAWTQRHKAECIRMTATADGIQKPQKPLVFKPPGGPRPSAVRYRRPWGVKLKLTKGPKHMDGAKEVLTNQGKLKENYSTN